MSNETSWHESRGIDAEPAHRLPAPRGEGFKWNVLVHRKPGEVDWPNPNLDVAYSEAWVALDEKSCLVVSAPRITGRYYTVQFLNGWGETVANINERVFPHHPNGEFAICLEGSDPAVPAGAQRIDVPVKHLRVLLRVALGATWDEAVALQRQFECRVVGPPALPTIPKTPIFDIETLLGVEAFEAAELALDSEADINPGMEELQATTRAIARAIKDPTARARVDQVIRSKAFAAFKQAMPTLGDGTVRNGWVLSSTIGVYGKNWLLRTLVNDGGIWANTMEEVIYYKAFVDPAGNPLSGDYAYTLQFPNDQLLLHRLEIRNGRGTPEIVPENARHLWNVARFAWPVPENDPVAPANRPVPPVTVAENSLVELPSSRAPVMFPA